MTIGAMISIAVVTGLTTAVGGLISNFFPVQRNGCLATVLGFAAGVMLGLSLFGLLPQAYMYSGSMLIAVWGFLGGLLLMVILGQLMKHGEGAGDGNYLKMGLFIAFGIALHNLPEGLALGSGFQSDPSLGFMIAIALLLHNIPEGISIGAPLSRAGWGPLGILALTAAAGLITPVGAVIGWIVADISLGAMGLAMGFAAGAMVFISCHELIYEGGTLHRGWCNLGIFGGLIITFMLG